MSAYKAKPPDQIGGDYDPSSLSKVQSFGDIPAGIRADIARFGSLGDFTLTLAGADPITAPTAGGTIFARSAAATNGWTDLQQFFFTIRNNSPTFPEYISLDELILGVESSITPIRFGLRNKTRVDSFVEFELGNRPAFFERNNTPVREISYTDTRNSIRNEAPNAYIPVPMTIFPHTIGLTGSVWKTGSFRALSSLYGLNTSFWLWYNSNFMSFRFLTNETISTQGMRYEYMLPTGALANAATAPFRIPSSITSGSQRPMAITLKRDITLSRLTPIVRRQSDIPRFGEVYELYWIYAGNNSYLNDILISSGVITKSITDIQTNIGIINNYNSDISRLDIEINTSSLLSATAITTRDNTFADRNLKCPLYSTNLEVYQTLSTAYVSTLSSYTTSLNEYIRISTQAFTSTQTSLSTIAALASSFSSIQDQYNASIRNYNLQTIIKPGLESSLPILYRISTLYASDDTTALRQLNIEYPNLSSIIQNYESTLRGPPGAVSSISSISSTTYSGVISTLSAGKWIQKAVQTTNFEDYFRAYLGIGGGEDGIQTQTGGGTSIAPSATQNPYFRIGRISEMIAVSESARPKRATLRETEIPYLNTKQRRDELYSTFYMLDQSSIEYYNKWQGFLSSKARLDPLYQSSLTEYNTAYVAYTTIYNQVAYLSSYRDEIIAFSTLERAKQRLRLLQESLDQFNAGYDGTPLYSTAIQSGGAVAADVTLAIQTQNVLINSAEAVYTTKQEARVEAEAKISRDRSGPLESTISGYNNLISNYLDEMTLYMDKVSTTQSTLNGLSTQWLTTRSRQIQSTFVIERFASTSTFYGNRLTQLRSNLETTSRDRLSKEMEYMLRQVDLADVLTNISSNIRDRAERVDEIATFCRRYEEAQRSYSTIVESMKSYAALFEQTYVPPQPLANVNIGQIRALYGIPETEPATTTMAGGAEPTYVTQSQITGLNVQRATELERFAAVTRIHNSTISSLARKELDTYSALLLELSTTIETDLSLKRYNFALNRQFNGSADVMSTFGYRDTPDYMRVLGLRETMKILLAHLENEQNTKEAYIQLKTNYDLQVYYSRTAATERETLTKTDFQVLKTQYDYSIQLVNGNVSMRRGYFDQIKSLITEFSTNGILDRQLAANFANSTIGTNSIIPSRQQALFDMSFNYVPLRTNYFTDPVVLQETQTPVCPDVQTTPAVQDRPVPIAPTTTAPNAACGYPIRFIEITHPSDTFHLTQVIAVDRTGRNVAFGASVSLTPAAFQTAKGVAAAVLTNGLTYSTELAVLSGAVSQNFTSLQGQEGTGKRIRIDLGAEFEITLIGIYIVPNSGYDTTGLNITTRNASNNTSPATSLNLNNPAIITGNVSPVFVDRRRPTAAPTCPIAILPQRRGICGLLARYVRIYRPVDAPTSYAFRFSQIAVIDSNGNNVALGDPVTFKPATGAAITTDSDNRNLAAVLTSGVYTARQATRCIRRVAAANDYLAIDLGFEADVAAVHIYNQIGGTSLLGCSVRLYTADYLLAEQRMTFSNGNREIIDFRYNGADANCSKLIRWPAIYGEAGIEARYIHIYKAPSATTRSFSFVVPANTADYNVRFRVNGQNANSIMIFTFRTTYATPNSIVIRGVEDTAWRDYITAPNAVIPFASLGITSTGGQTITITFNGTNMSIRTSVSGLSPITFTPSAYFLTNGRYNIESIDFISANVINPQEIRDPYALLTIKGVNRNGGNATIGKQVQVYNATTPTEMMLINSIYPSAETFMTPIRTLQESQITIDLGTLTEICSLEVAGLSTADTNGISVGFSVPPSAEQFQLGTTRTFQIVTPAMPTLTTTIAGFEHFGVVFRNPNGDIVMQCSARFSLNGSALTTFVEQSQIAATNTWSTEQAQTHANYGITRGGGQMLTITLNGQNFIIRSLTTGFSYIYTPPTGFPASYDIRTIRVEPFNIPNFTEIMRFVEPSSFLTNPYQQFVIYIRSIGASGTLWTTGNFSTLYSLFGINNPFFCSVRNSSTTNLRLRITFTTAPTTTTCATLLQKETNPGTDVWTPIISTDGISVNATNSTNTPTTILLLTTSLIYDTRYDPEDSQFPITEDPKRAIAKFGNSGLYAQHILLPIPNTSPLTLLADSAYTLTDITGKNIGQIDTGLQRTITRFDGSPYMKVSLTRIWELSAVGIVGSPNAMIVVLDCNENIAWIDVTGTTALANISVPNVFIADFRKIDTIDRTRANAPVYPYPTRYGPRNKGILTRYIQVEPPSSAEGLYISQIIAVNACGRNSAFEGETYASAGSATASLAVDGRYEDQLALNVDPIFLYQNYLQKPLANSYQSGPTTNLQWIVDLGRMFSLSQEGTTTLTGISNPQTFCNQMISNTACGGVYQLDSTYEHEINCVIFVAPQGKKADCEGVIVKLLDGGGQLVGVRRVTRLVNIFGVDFLDFRRDTSENLGTAIVEIPQREVRRGPNNCGIMAMYIRIEQEASSNPAATSANPIRLSQIFVLDHQGCNIALYKPTKSNRIGLDNLDTSYLAVDGRYFEKDSTGSFISDARVGQYIEVNLGCEMPVTKIMAINARVDKDDAAFFAGLVVKVYNQTRDVILVQKLSAAAAGAWTLANTARSKKLDKAGVNIQNSFYQRAFDEGLIPSEPSPKPIEAIALSPLASCDPGFDLSPILIRGNSTYKGVLTSYIRIYNPNSYIQISQLMIFDDSLTNIARTLPQSRVFATHALPGRQPERAVDGVGGYFHVGRPENQCYISEKKPYEFWQIDVRTETGEPREIVAIRYVPPSSNMSRNKGLRFQLIKADAPPIAIGGTQTIYYEVRWPATPSGNTADQSQVLRFKHKTLSTPAYLEFKATFKENNVLVQDANIVRISGAGFTTQVAAASAFGITREGGAKLYFSISPNSIKIKNADTGYEYPTAITPTSLIPTDNIVGEFSPPEYIRQVDAAAVSQYVVSEFVLRTDTYDQTIDFRQPTLTPRPITEVLSPRIIAPDRNSVYYERLSVQPNFGTTTINIPFQPSGIVEDSAGSLYISNDRYIYRYGFSSNLNRYLTGSVIIDMGPNVRINALAIDSGNRLWFTTSGTATTLYSTSNVSITGTITFTPFSTINFTNLNGICVTNTTIYVSRDEPTGVLYSINRTGGVVTQVGPTLGSPRGIAIRTEFQKDILYVCCADDYKVRRFDIAANFTELAEIGIGISDTNTQIVSEKMYTYFQSPYGIFNDITTNTLYITDSLGNKVYYVPPDPSSGIDAKVYTLAGTGAAGNNNPLNAPALDALLNQPTNGIVSRRTGNYIFIDYNNNSLRIILLDQMAAITTFTDKVLPQTLWPTTTLPGESIQPLPSIPILPQALNRTRDTIKELANTGRLKTSS